MRRDISAGEFDEAYTSFRQYRVSTYVKHHEDIICLYFHQRKPISRSQKPRTNLLVLNRELALRFLILLAKSLELFDRLGLQNFR